MADSNEPKSSRVIEDIIKAGKRGVASVAIVAGGAGLVATPSTADAQQDIIDQIGKIIPKAADQYRRVVPGDAPRQAYPGNNNNRPGNTYSQSQNNQGYEQQRQDLYRNQNSAQPYTFKTPMSESLGTADVTNSVSYIAETDKRFTPAAREAYGDLMNSIELLQSGVIPDGMKKFNANPRLTAQDRAQVIGSALAYLRSESPISANNSGHALTPQDIEMRTMEAGKTVALFVRAMPEAKNIRYTWTAPDMPFVEQAAIESASGPNITTRGKTMSGNLGAFLASGFQDNRPNTDADAFKSTYRLYGEVMRPGVLSFVDSQISKPYPTKGASR